MNDFSDWPHAPEHRLGGSGVFMVTAGTYQKARLFNTPEKLDTLCGGLRKYADQYGWQLQAWAVLANHYHYVELPEKVVHAVALDYPVRFTS